MENNFDGTPTEQDKENENASYPNTQQQTSQGPHYPIGDSAGPPQAGQFGHYGYNQPLIHHHPGYYQPPIPHATPYQGSQAAAATTTTSAHISPQPQPQTEEELPSAHGSTLRPEETTTATSTSAMNSNVEPGSYNIQPPQHPHPQLPPPHPYYPPMMHPHSWPYHHPGSSAPPYQPPPIYPGGPYPPHGTPPSAYPHGQPYPNHYDSSNPHYLHQQSPASTASNGTSPGTSSSYASSNGGDQSPHVPQQEVSGGSSQSLSGSNGNKQRQLPSRRNAVPPQHEVFHRSSETMMMQNHQHQVPKKRLKMSPAPSSGGGTVDSSHQVQQMSSEAMIDPTNLQHSSSSFPPHTHPQALPLDSYHSLNINSLQPHSIHMQVSNMSLHTTDLPPIPPKKNTELDSTVSQTVLERRARKNKNSRIRAARLKDRIAEIQKKDPSERTEEESDTLQLYEERRERKNTRSRELAIEKKQRMDQIMQKPESEWTHEEKTFVEETMTSKYRKNLGDRLRRKRIKELKKSNKK